MKCRCDKKFDIPECCGRYLEDPEGTLVHTEKVCYRTTPAGAPASHTIIEILPGSVALEGTS